MSMKVNVTVRGINFTLPCAEGDQNIKWLALASAHVFARQHIPKARTRLREQVSSAPGTFLPANVRLIGQDEMGNVIKENLSPISLVKDVIKDGGSVEVELIDEISVGRNGIPEPPAFYVNAFSTNKQIKDRLKDRLEAQRQKDEAIRIKDKLRKEEARRRIFGSIDSAAALAFEKEFDQIKKKGFISDDAVDDLQETLARYFEELDLLFRHFSGFAAGESIFISYAEFTHCMHKTRMFDVVKDANILKQIFAEADIVLTTDKYSDGAFHRAEFVEALVRVAQYRWRESAVADAMDNLMQDFILPFLDKCKVTEIQQTLESQEVRAIAGDNFVRLFRVFRRYSKHDFVHSKSKPTEAGTMNLNEFRSMLRESGLIPIPGTSTAGETQKRRSRSRQTVKTTPAEETFARKAFSRAQLSTEGAEITDLGEMTYPEFIEGLMWFAMLQKTAENDYVDYKHMSLIKRVESFNDVVQALVTHQINHEKREQKAMLK